MLMGNDEGCTRGYMPEPLPGLLARLSGAIWCRRIHRMNRTEHSLVLMGNDEGFTRG